MIPDPLYIVDIFQEVCEAVSAETSYNINYVYGLSIHISDNLMAKDKSKTLKDTKYPLIALFMPFEENRGKGYYADVLIRKIVIAYLTNKDDRPNQRYENVFKTTLYPVYYSFLKQLARNKYSNQKNPDFILHKKIDYPGVEQVTGVNDFVDSIEILNLQIPLKQIKYC